MYSVCVRTDNSKFGLRYTKKLRTMGMRRSRGGGGEIWTSLENSDLKSTPLSYQKKASEPRKTRISHGPPSSPPGKNSVSAQEGYLRQTIFIRGQNELMN